MKVSPWEVEGLVDYNRLIKDFGIQKFDKIPEELKKNKFFRRHIIFGHRDYDKILEAMRLKKDWAVMSGFMPSGSPHFGHKMTMEEIIWHQNAGGQTFVCIADIEAYAVRGLSFSKTKRIGLEYIKSLIALGLKDDAYIYYQSACEDVKNLAIKLSCEVNWSELKSIYGFNPETTLAKMFVSVIQAADILQPQLKKFGGPKPTVIPVGADQDPHIRLTRDIAARSSIFSFEKIENGVRVRSRKGKHYLDYLESKLEFDFRRYEEHIDIFGSQDEIEKTVRNIEIEVGGPAFILPSATYHRFIIGLTGGKMSSSKPETVISLLDDPTDAEKKVMKAITGGRGSAEEQRKLGGIPDKCSIFELYKIHLLDDDHALKEIEQDCRQGKLLCGYCKKMASELVKDFLKEHQAKISDAERMLKDYTIVMNTI